MRATHFTLPQRRGRSASLLAAAVLSLFFVYLCQATAAADTPKQQFLTTVANDIRHQQAVYQDSNPWAPKISDTQVAQLDDQIKSIAKPIVIVIPSEQNAHLFTGPSDLASELHQQLGTDTKQVIAVSTSTHFNAMAFNVSRDVAIDTPGLAKQAARHYPGAENNAGDRFQLYVAWTSHVGSLGHLPKGVSPTETKTGNALLVIGVIAGILIVGAVVIVLVVFYVKRRRHSGDDRRDKNRLQLEIDSLNDDFLSVSAGSNVTASQAIDAGQRELQTAELNLGRNDLDEARRYIGTARSNLRAAQSTLGITTAASSSIGAYASSSRSASPVTRARQSSASNQRRQSSQQRQSGQRQTVQYQGRNVPYSTAPTAQYSNYYAGGYMGGTYWGPGYYPSPIDTLLDVMILDSFLDDFHDNDYGDYNGNDFGGNDGNGSGGYDDNSSNDSGTYDSVADDSSWNDSSGSSDGWGDSGGGSSDSGSGDSGSSWGDSGGGFDSGGGSDFGGGGDSSGW